MRESNALSLSYLSQSEEASGDKAVKVHLV